MNAPRSMTREQYQQLLRAERDSIAARHKRIRELVALGVSYDDAMAEAPEYLWIAPKWWHGPPGRTDTLLILQRKRREETLARVKARKRWEAQARQIECAAMPEFAKTVSLDFIGPRPAHNVRRIAA